MQKSFFTSSVGVDKLKIPTQISSDRFDYYRKTGQNDPLYAIYLIFRHFDPVRLGTPSTENLHLVYVSKELFPVFHLTKFQIQLSRFVNLILHTQVGVPGTAP